MRTSYTIEAPCKINLHLAVGDKASDGYHPLRSIFQTVDFCDHVKVTLDTHAEGITIRGDFDCPPEKNTAYKAAALFFDKLHRDIHTIKIPAVTIAIKKEIPSGAGLGGGSSDAAAVLLLLNKHYGHCSEKELAQIALQVGADVPFFLQGGAALVEGRGEIITPIKARSDFTMAIVQPKFSINTKEAYGLLDQSREQQVTQEESDPIEALSLDALHLSYYRSPRNWNFFNSFEPALFPHYEQLTHYKNALYKAGAEFALMSGSGSSLLGIFPPTNDTMHIKREFLYFLGHSDFKIFVGPPRTY